MTSFQHRLVRLRRAMRSDGGLSLAVTATLGFTLALAGPVLAAAAAQRVATAPAAGTPPWDRLEAGGGWTSALRMPTTVQYEAAEAMLWILASVAMVVVAAAALNVVTLLVARGAARRGDNAVRAALGASPLGLARTAAWEGARAGFGGAAGGALAGGAAGVLLARAWPTDPLPWMAGAPHPHALLLFAGIGATVVTLLALLATPLRFRRGLHAHLTTGGRATAGPGEGLLRRMLAVLQFAAAVTLVTTAAVMLRGAIPADAATATAGSSDPRDTLALRLAMPGEAAERAALAREALTSLRGLSGVLDAGAASPGALLGLGPEDQIATVCPTCARGGMGLPVLFGTPRHHAVSPGFFAARGIPLVRGRGFDDAPVVDDERTVVINLAFAGQLLPGADPVGQRIHLTRRWMGPDFYTVAGVVDDAPAPGLGNGADPVPAVYLSARRSPPRELEIALRTTGDPLALEPAVRAALAAVDVRLAPRDVATLQAVLDASRAPLSWFAVVLVALGVGAVVLSAGGLYGVMRFAVAQRTRELGVRMAVGAREGDVMGQVLREGLRLAVWGTVVGLIGALSATRMLQLLFVGVRPFDAGAFAAAAVLLTVTALVASWLPARAATRVDPMVALRAE
jgi:putative ABC transport system permease protein